MLEFAAGPLEGQELDVPYLRKTLLALVSRVKLDPVSRSTRPHFRVRITGAKWRPHRAQHLAPLSASPAYPPAYRAAYGYRAAGVSPARGRPARSAFGLLC